MGCERRWICFSCSCTDLVCTALIYYLERDSVRPALAGDRPSRINDRGRGLRSGNGQFSTRFMDFASVGPSLRPEVVKLLVVKKDVVPQIMVSSIAQGLYACSTSLKAVRAWISSDNRGIRTCALGRMRPCHLLRSNGQETNVSIGLEKRLLSSLGIRSARCIRDGG